MDDLLLVEMLVAEDNSRILARIGLYWILTNRGTNAG